MDEPRMRRVLDAVKGPHPLAMAVAMGLVFWALAMDSMWVAPLAIIAGAMAGERDASRRVYAALLAKGDER